MTHEYHYLLHNEGHYYYSMSENGDVEITDKEEEAVYFSDYYRAKMARENIITIGGPFFYIEMVILFR